MKTILKNILIAVLAVVLFIGYALPCFATAQNTKITVVLEDTGENPVNDVAVNLCQIAASTATGYVPAKAFEASGISISGIVNNPDEAVAKSLLQYAKEHKAPSLSNVSKDGTVCFSNLDLGIWLVYGDENSRYTFNPYIVFLPFESGGKVYYEIASAPKLEDRPSDEVNIYVVKKWEDKNNASKKRPSSVTVDLLNGNTVVASIALREENGWAHTFPKLRKDGHYSVREQAVANYQAAYSGDAANGFVVTNTYIGDKLPQTGQYWWPLVLIAVAGVGFVLLGVMELGVKKDGKKK